MSELLRRGQSPSQVSDWNPSSNTVTPPSQTHFFVPFGLTLQQTIQSSGSVTIPAGIDWVYVVMTGGGASGGAGSASGGKAGEVSWGWTPVQNTCIIGAGAGGSNAPGGYSRYGNVIAVGGSGTGAGVTNYWGIPGGTSGGGVGSNGGSGSSGGNGGNGISGGGGNLSGSGGSGLVGGGGGGTSGGGGAGGNGLGVNGTVYTGGTTASAGGGGGGAGIAANGSNATGSSGAAGGLGGGGGGGNTGAGGAGILYIYY